MFDNKKLLFFEQDNKELLKISIFLLNIFYRYDYSSCYLNMRQIVSQIFVDVYLCINNKYLSRLFSIYIWVTICY
jgi:hypothetical protein